jgi:hypothetical protein
MGHSQSKQQTVGSGRGTDRGYTSGGVGKTWHSKGRGGHRGTARGYIRRGGKAGTPTGDIPDRGVGQAGAQPGDTPAKGLE